MGSFLRQIWHALTYPLVSAVRYPYLWVPALTLTGVLALGGGVWLLLRSWALALVIALALVLIVLVVVLLTTIFRQEREERLQAGVDDPDDLEASRRERAEEAWREDLEARFRSATEEIRSSRLGPQGLYEVPWLLVIGETGAGKTEALRQSGLDLPAEYAHVLRGGSTRDCEWWLTNQLIVLDTSGRYLEAGDEARQQWRRLLRLLRRSRPKRPLEGLVVAVSAAGLLSRSPAELAQAGRELRLRMNALTETLRVDVPVYVLVTQSDRIEGFTELVSSLPPERLREAFGWTNSRRTWADAGQLALAGLDGLRERLEDLLPELVMREADVRRRRRLFLFPEEFQEACRALADLLRAAFAPTIYDEMPFLRGVYFSSALRQGETVSPLLRRLGCDWARTPLQPQAGPAGGWYLYDFFREIVLGDRDISLPARWLGRRTRRAIGWAVAGAALVSLTFLGFAFVDNLRAIRRLAGESEAVIAGASSLAALEHLRETVVARDAAPFPLGRLGLNGPTRYALDRSRRSFAWAFGREYEEPTKAKLIGTVRSYDRDSFEALAELGLDVSWLAHRADEEQASRPSLVAYAPVGRDEADIAAFRKGYDAFVRWIPREEIRSRIGRERDVVHAGAGRLLDLSRLDAWSERSAETHPPIRYRDFGIRVGKDQLLSSVPGAYTRATWERLVGPLIEAVEQTGGASSESVGAFREGYTKRYDMLWRGFLVDVPILPHADRQVKDSPYVAFVEALDHNLRAELPRAIAPPAFVGVLQEVRREQPDEAETERQQRAPWQSYTAALEQVQADVTAAVSRPERALGLAVKLTRTEPVSFDSALDGLRELVPIEADTEATAKLQEVLSMPFLNGASAVLEAATDELDRRWRERVVGPFAGELDASELEGLYREGSGELARFESEALAPFYREGAPVPVIGKRRLPFGPAFLRWMDLAEDLRRSLFPGQGKAPEFTVRLEGVPSRLTGSPGFFVTKRELRLSCADKAQTFVYREGVESHVFRWTPDCSQVTLRVWVRSPGGQETELRPPLERNGALAFPIFLQEAERLSARRLQRRIQYDEPPVELTLEYRLRSGEAILDIAHRPPPDSLRN